MSKIQQTPARDALTAADLTARAGRLLAIVSSMVYHAAAAKAAPTRGAAAPHLTAAAGAAVVLMDLGITAEHFAELVATARQTAPVGGAR